MYKIRLASKLNSTQVLTRNARVTLSRILRYFKISRSQEWPNSNIEFPLSRKLKNKHH